MFPRGNQQPNSVFPPDERMNNNFEMQQHQQQMGNAAKKQARINPESPTIIKGDNPVHTYNPKAKSDINNNSANNNNNNNQNLIFDKRLQNQHPANSFEMIRATTGTQHRRQTSNLAVPSASPGTFDHSNNNRFSVDEVPAFRAGSYNAQQHQNENHFFSTTPPGSHHGSVSNLDLAHYYQANNQNNNYNSNNNFPAGTNISPAHPFFGASGTQEIFTNLPPPEHNNNPNTAAAAFSPSRASTPPNSPGLGTKPKSNNNSKYGSSDTKYVKRSRV
jgi:hypothetical protein